MRDFVQVYINGKSHKIFGDNISLTLSDYLRYQANLRGTKVVCAEGDCGACTVMVGKTSFKSKEVKYTSINSCISMMALLDGSHIVTIEGVKTDGDYNEIQKCMVDNNGAQCGFCTPGFVMSLTDLYENKEAVDEKKCRNYLTGNLCRCTGYSSILDAALSVDRKKIVKLEDQYNDSDLKDFLSENVNSPFNIITKNIEFYAPKTLKEASELRQKYSDLRLISSATDIGVQINKERFEPYRLLSLQKIEETYELSADDNFISIGARANLTEIENFLEDKESEFSEFLRIFASPQIKNFGTLIGNVANASPIGDTLPYLSVMEARVVLLTDSGEKEVPFTSFYKGYKQLNMGPQDIIIKVIVPRVPDGEFLKIYKVSRRKDLDISSVNAAIRMKLDGEKIEKINISYGGVGPTILRLPKLEKDLCGKDFVAETFREGSYKIKDEITPMSDVRGTEEYRQLVAKNLFQRFYLEVSGDRS